MTAYVRITNYGAETVTVCTDCGRRMSHGADDQAAASDAAAHRAGHHQ